MKVCKAAFMWNDVNRLASHFSITNIIEILYLPKISSSILSTLDLKL